MYKPTSPQLTLTEPAFLMAGILPKDDWSFIYKDKIWPLIDEKLFKHLYSEKAGAPNISIKLKLSLLIFMALEQLNWRQVEFMFMRRLDWINATYSEFGQTFIDHTTLFKFYQQLADDESTYQLFVNLTNKFVETCGVSTKRQRVDSFFMLGWLATLSRYGLFKETIKSFLQALRKHKPGLYAEVKDELSLDYLQDHFDLTEKDKDKARGRIKEMAKDLYLLKTSFEHHHQIGHYQTFKTLAQVFDQQCAVKSEDDLSTSNDVDSDKEVIEITENTDATGPEIEIREKPVGDKIISSPHNTDAEYTRKRTQTVVGHKGFLTETCDPDNKVQFITDVNLETATHADATEISLIEQRLEDNGLKPEELNADAGFVNGQSILEAAARGIDLAGPSSGRSQSIEGFADIDRPLDIADFKVLIDDETKELSVLYCPEAQVPIDQPRSEKTGKILVHFNSDVCKACGSAERCPVKIGVKIATLTVDEAQYAGAARHHQYMGDPEYRRKCGIRAGAESLVNEIANAHDGRQSRHRNENGSRLQLVMAGISCNVKRFIRFTQNCVQNPSNVPV
jgi:Pyruvate/2-oxoacid:ferredoxin oxidoreductase delta subunit